MTEDNSNRVETPKGRVEILPPEDQESPPGRYDYSTSYGTIKIVKLGPFGSVLLALGLGLMLLCGFIFLSGALLFLLPLVGLLAAGAALSGFLSNPFRRLR
ncbi:MAG: hypothetical protein WB816_12435 [Methylocystis sp.]